MVEPTLSFGVSLILSVVFLFLASICPFEKDPALFPLQVRPPPLPAASASAARFTVSYHRDDSLHTGCERTT